MIERTRTRPDESMDGSVLFLCCCSNRKLAGGERSYRAEHSLPEALGQRGQELLDARQRVLRRIRSGARSIQGTALRDLPYNHELADGRDLGGAEAGRYMPAMQRYRGRFFQELDPEEAGTLDGGPRRWLVVSALYGLVASNEPIQRYSCHTLDNDEIVRIWSGGLLTSLLLHYVRLFNVRLVVDLLADASYRQLFDWERVGNRSIRVLRAYGEQNAGPGLLPALGFLARTTLALQSTEELLGIEGTRTFITDYEDVVLTSGVAPPAPFLGDESQPEKEPASVEPLHERPPAPVIVDDETAGCVVLPRPREIPVTSRGHNTIFDRQIGSIRDLPTDARRLLDAVSRAAEVTEVRLGPFSPRGASREFSLALMPPPRAGTGTIDGKLTGKAKIGGTQRLQIRVTPGRELAAYLALDRLLAKEVL